MFDCTLYIFDDFEQLRNDIEAYAEDYDFCTPPELGTILMTGRYKRSMIVDIFHNLVHQPAIIVSIRVKPSVQDKAWDEGNGCSLTKSHNAVLDAWIYSLRESHEALIPTIITG